MTRAGDRLPSRREVLAASAALTLSGCLPGDDGEPSPPDPELLMRARAASDVRSLAQMYVAAAARHPEAAGQLSSFAAEHEAHARALLPRRAARMLRPSDTPEGSPSPNRSAGPPSIPATLPETRRMLADEERAASRRRERQAVRASPTVARLFASIAACESAHAALLTGRP